MSTNDPPETIYPLRFWDVKVGFGVREAQPGDIVGITFEGRLLNRSLRQAYERSMRPLMFQIGMGRVIPGLEAGIIGMKIGGVREMLIPPEYAYGRRGSYHKYPPHRIIYFRVNLLHLDRQSLPKGMKYTSIPRTDLTPYYDKKKGYPRIGVRFQRPEKEPESQFELGLRLLGLYKPLPMLFSALKDRWFRFEQEWKRIKLAPSYKRIRAKTREEMHEYVKNKEAIGFKKFLAQALIDPQEEYSEIAEFELTLLPLEELLIMYIRRLGIINRLPEGTLDKKTMDMLRKEREEALRNFDLEQVKAKLDLVRTEETEDLIEEILEELQREMKPYEPPERWI